MSDATITPTSLNVSRITLLSVAGMLLLAVIWGLSIPITKLGLETMPPMVLTALRFGVAVPFLFLFAIGRHRIPLRVLPKVAALGLLGIGVGQVSQTFGIAEASASVSTIISAMIPIFIVIFAAIRLGQSVSLRQKLGLAGAFGGIALVALDRGGAAAGVIETTLAGAALVLLSALTIAFYYVWSVEQTNRYGTVTVAAWSTLAGFLAIVPFALHEAATTPFTVEPKAIASAVYLGLAVTAAGLFLWLWLLRTIPARIAASVQFLQPVFGIGASAALFGDRMGGLFLIGVAFVLAGVALTVIAQRK
ncbi:DMT family transporter [Pseudooceanicola onchidii]|uniref:DMT family transporter n=1 Tax=Pseudooceanicola onchidii TaxID=2562279 RepID=UPI00197D52C5|nr:DMT family transporter [Pseudooceanicola onchidii]